MTKKIKQKNYELRILDNRVYINETPIDNKIFQEEKSDYQVVSRTRQIDDLIMWISQTKSYSDKSAMKEDLKYLLDLQDNFVFSSVSTNEFIAESDNKKEFNKICEEILKLNEEIEKNKYALF